MFLFTKHPFDKALDVSSIVFRNVVQYCTCLGIDWIIISCGFCDICRQCQYDPDSLHLYFHIFSKKFHIFKSCNNKLTSEQKMIHLFNLVLVTVTLCSVCSGMFLSRCLSYLCYSDTLCVCPSVWWPSQCTSSTTSRSGRVVLRAALS